MVNERAVDKDAWNIDNFWHGISLLLLGFCIITGIIAFFLFKNHLVNGKTAPFAQSSNFLEKSPQNQTFLADS